MPRGRSENERAIAAMKRNTDLLAKTSTPVKVDQGYVRRVLRALVRRGRTDASL